MTITEDRIHCPACGSADVDRRGTPEGRRTHDCFRCSRAFEPRRCPHCGGARIDGSIAISGMPLQKSRTVVKCWDCSAELPALDDPYGG
ncbi:hypothetical protein ABZ747_17725 [Kitasatospora cineracea]|uniref:hypothetical protein n=1 Tax=Kitasatospora cineracea TaxID=88074 RepID=UPI0033D35534